MFSMIKSYEKGLRYCSFRKSAPNHRSLTLMRNGKVNWFWAKWAALLNEVVGR